MPYPPQYRCLGRDYPRIPRGWSGGFLDGNWPLVWKVESGPIPGGLWAAFEGLIFWQDQFGTLGSPHAQWSWAPGGPFAANIRVQISKQNPDQSEWRHGLDVLSSGMGGGGYGSGANPWVTVPRLDMEYTNGTMPGWTNKEDNFVLVPATYADLPANFCLP